MPDIVLPQEFDLNIDPATIFLPDEFSFFVLGADTTPGADAGGPDAVSGAGGLDTTPDPAADAPPPADPAADPGAADPSAPDAPGVDMTFIPFDDGPYPQPEPGGWLF